MSGALITKGGRVLVSGGTIEALVDYGKKVKVTAVDIMSYINDVAQIYVSYADGAVGAVRGLSKSALWSWASEQKKWPLRITHQISVPYPTVLDPAPEPVVAVMRRSRPSVELPATEAEAPAARIRRSRVVNDLADEPVEGTPVDVHVTKRIRRTR